MSAALQPGYENAPATQLLASYCACCSRPLVDSISVEAGIGPVCREKHGYAERQGDPDWTAAKAVLAATGVEGLGYVAMSWAPHPASSLTGAAASDGDAHKAANVLVHRIALGQEGPLVVAMTNALRHLGYAKLAERIAERLCQIRIDLEAGRYVVHTPYSEQAVAAMRRVPGRRWDAERKANTFPKEQRVALWATLMALFPGEPARGPAGLFTIAT